MDTNEYNRQLELARQGLAQFPNPADFGITSGGLGDFGMPSQATRDIISASRVPPSGSTTGLGFLDRVGNFFNPKTSSVDTSKMTPFEKAYIESLNRGPTGLDYAELGLGAISDFLGYRQGREQLKLQKGQLEDARERTELAKAELGYDPSNPLGTTTRDRVASQLGAAF